MLPRKQRILLMIIIPVFIIAIVGLSLMILLLKTDFMKSNDVLFKEYFSQNFNTISNLTNFDNLNMYENILQTSNYESSLNTTITNLENTDKNIKISVDGKTDNINNKEYKNIQLKNNDDKLIQLEYIKQDNIYGIKFSDFFKQYISIRNEKLKELVQKSGITGEQVSNIPDTISEDIDIFNDILFTQEEKEQLFSKYSHIIFNNISNEKYSKQKNSLITVNDVSLNTNAYKITLSKEEYNNMVINVLEQVKEDDVILNKMKLLEKNLSEIGISNLELKQQIVDELDKKIKEIKDNNIGTEQVTIIVYQYKGELVRTSIENDTQKIIIDRVLSENSEKMVIEVKEISEDEEKATIEITKKAENMENVLEIKLENVSNKSNKAINVVINNSKVDNTINKNFLIEYSKDNSDVKIENQSIINIKDAVNLENIDENNNIILNDLTQEQITNLFGTVTEKITPSITTITSLISEITPIKSKTSDTSFLNQNEENVTELQKNRFNAKFEIYAGEEVSSSDVKNMISSIENDLGGIEVINNDTLKMLVEKNKENKELAEKVSDVINDTDTYKIEMQYDNETGLISCIILTRNVENNQ